MWLLCVVLYVDITRGCCEYVFYMGVICGGCTCVLSVLCLLCMGVISGCCIWVVYIVFVCGFCMWMLSVIVVFVVGVFVGVVFVGVLWCL